MQTLVSKDLENRVLFVENQSLCLMGILENTVVKHAKEKVRIEGYLFRRVGAMRFMSVMGIYAGIAVTGLNILIMSSLIRGAEVMILQIWLHAA